jgi:hypothetical protein
MLWLKMVLGYCVLVGVGLWLGYRSRRLWPSQSEGPSGPDIAASERPVQPRPSSATGLR